MISKKRVIAGSIVLSLAACLIYFQNSNDDFAANHGELSTLKNEKCDKIESSSSAEFSTPLPIQFKSTSSLNKVFFESSLDSVRGSSYQLDVELAKNEYEATQLLISADSNISNVSVEVSDLINCETQSTLKASEHVEINTVAYINVDVENQKANLEEPVLVASNGWYPDPLLRNQRIILKPNELQPFLITINTSQETHAGDYTGNVIIRDQSNRGVEVPIRVRVWDFELPKVSRFKTASFLHWGMAKTMWGDDFVDKHRFRLICHSGIRNCNTIQKLGYNEEKICLLSPEPLRSRAMNDNKTNYAGNMLPLDDYLSTRRPSGRTVG